MADPYRYFRIEASELVGQLDQSLLELEQRAPDGAADPEVVRRVLRYAHTLKGAARIVKHAELARLAHELEDALAPLRAGGGVALPRASELVAAMAGQLAALSAPAAQPSAPGIVIPAAAVLEPDAPQPDAAAPLARVDGDVLGHVLGELDEAQALLSAARTAHPALAELEMIDRELAAARRGAEQLRLQPAGVLFRALERTARDAARDTGKAVQLTTGGGELRIESRLLAGLQGALIQLVRNAVAHGIEPAAVRVAAGKPATGRVTVDVRLRGDRVSVRCEDDGGGIDLGAVRTVLAARGESALTDDALIARLLRGGLSTQAEITPLAGRGVGLDVVREAAQALAGEVSVRTRAGQGVSVTIVVPFVLTGLNALVASVDHHTVVLPRTQIRRVAAIGPAVLHSGVLPGEGCPVAALGRVLGCARGTPRAAIVLAAGDGLAAVAVDRVDGFEDVIVRRLPGVPLDPVIRGIALDGSGRPRPVLEPAALIAAVARTEPEPEVVEAPRLPILVVDDSLTSRMLEQSILEAAGYEVDTAVSAEAGLARAAERVYGLFLVDVEMPGLDGFGFISRLRTHSRTPAVLVTSRDAPADRQRGEDVGAQGYLIKGTLDPGELLGLVARLLA